jgi:hypothetical protein
LLLVALARFSGHPLVSFDKLVERLCVRDAFLEKMQRQAMSAIRGQADV